MCGIAGLIARHGGEPDPAVLERLAAALAHRGPDGRGVWRDGPLALVHTRLAIIDLATGDQPLHGPDGRVLVGNGEIYNYRELKAGLPGVAWATGSDCEPPLWLHARFGPDFADSLRGMWGLAIAEPGAHRLTLSRDPFGIKPLYLAEGPFGVAFASEIQALVAAGLAAPGVDPTRRAELLQMQFTTGAPTIVPGVRRLLPGETVVVEAGRVSERRRRPALPPPADDAPPLSGEAEALAALEAALVESIDLHQRADVPYGMFLSGGVDSAAVLALMARLNSRPVLAFTAGFPGSGVADERDHARAVAAAVGAEHVDLAVEEADLWRWLPAIAASLDDPCADYAVIPTWLLARKARAAVKVILSGEGGDELFAGYGRYRTAARPWPFARVMRRKGSFDGLDVLHPGITEGWRDGLAAAEAEAARRWPASGRMGGGMGGSRGGRLTRAQAVDVADWLPNDLLTKLDRCLMAHGVEGRVPFLDPAVAGVALRLAPSLRVRDGHGKWLLRRWVEKTLPVARPFTAKRGFTVPVGQWIGGQGAALGPLVAAQPGVAEIARPDRVAALFRAAATGKREGFAAWTLLFYALWHARHVLGQPADGGVFEVLAASSR